MHLLSRAAVFFLASLSFACLLGTFYGLWSMRAFACTVLPPAALLLGLMAWRARRRDGAAAGPYVWVVEGTLGGLVAAVAYDLYRLPYVLAGTPLFKVFPRFGEMILEAAEPAWLTHLLGWAYHFSNGAALGIMFLALVPAAGPRVLFWGAVAWALLIEVMLLLTPYANFFGLALDSWFVFLTASAHLVFGVTLGLWCRYRLAAAAVG